MKAAWKEYQFGDCATLLSGGTPSKSHNDYWEGDLPWVSCKDMKVDRIYDAEDHLSPLGAQNGTRVVPENTILFVVRGMILAKSFPVAITKRPVAFNQDLKAVMRADFIETEFLYYWLKANSYEILGRADEAGHGTKRIQTDRLLSLPIRIPSPLVQHQIASILSAYDDLIENNQRRIKILEEMARSLYREWFVHFRFLGHEKAKMVPSPLGPIPQGWEVKRVPECVDINPRVIVPRDGEKPFVPMGCLSNDSMLIDEIESRHGNSGAKFQNGDTLFARITPCLENGKTGFVQFLPDDQAVACGSTEFIVLRSHTLTPEFVYLLARSDEFRRLAIKSMTGATGRQRVQEQCFNGFRIAEPPRALLDLFSAFVLPSFRLIHSLDLRTHNLRHTRDLLLPRLLSGQVNLESVVAHSSTGIDQ